MREIKFRAWDNRHKIMYSFELIELPYSDNVNLDGQFDGLLCMDYKLMQYTGLKDKNGVEIYEGDILARCFDDYDEHCEVFYDYAICSVRTLKSKEVRPLNIKANKNGCGWCNVDGGSSCYDFRVIGNIYQNPELLEK